MSTVTPDATTPEAMGREAFIADRLATYTERGLSPADVLDAATDAEEAGRGELAGWYRDVARRMARPVPRPVPAVSYRHPVLARILIVAAMAYLAVCAAVAIGTLGEATHAFDVLDTAQVATVPVVASVSPVEHSAGSMAPVGPVSEDDPAWQCQSAGNGQCGPSAAGGPVLDAGELVCTDPASTLIVNGVGVSVCDYHLISTR